MMARRKGVSSALASNRNRVSNAQTEALVTFMEQHPLFARGQVTKLGAQGHLKYKKMWRSLALQLNIMGPCKKDELGWQRYWTKIRLAAKEEKAKFLKSLNKTGHNSPDRSFTEFNERVSCIYGRFGTGVNLNVELGLQIEWKRDNEDFLHLVSDLLTLADYIQTALNSTSIFQDVIRTFDERMRNIFQDGPRSNQRPSERQYAILFAVLGEKYRTLSIATDNPLTRQEWQELAATLNQGDGVMKTPRAWIKTWMDLLHAARQAMTLMLNEERLSPVCDNHVAAIDLAGYRVLSSKRPCPTNVKKTNPTFCGLDQLLPRAESPYPASDDEEFEEPHPKKPGSLATKTRYLPLQGAAT